MAKQTLLTMTQNILSAMSSDEVNSISDTAESLQIANIIQNKYRDIVSREGTVPYKRLFKLDSSNDVNLPVIMYIPAAVSKLDWLKYFNSGNSDGEDSTDFSHDLNVDVEDSDDDSSGSPLKYEYVTILPIQQFLDTVNAFNPDDTNVGTLDFNEQGNTFTLYYKTDKQPQYCTVIGNYYVVFDSYDEDFDTTLQNSKTMCFGELIPDFSLTDSFIPDLDDNLFPLLFNESKALAFYELKQMPHAKAEQEIKRQWSAIQSNKAVSDKPSFFDQLPNFGRVINTGGYGGRASVKLR